MSSNMISGALEIEMDDDDFAPATVISSEGSPRGVQAQPPTVDGDVLMAPVSTASVWRGASSGLLHDTSEPMDDPTEAESGEDAGEGDDEELMAAQEALGGGTFAAHVMSPVAISPGTVAPTFEPVLNSSSALTDVGSVSATIPGSVSATLPDHELVDGGSDSSARAIIPDPANIPVSPPVDTALVNQQTPAQVTPAPSSDHEARAELSNKEQSSTHVAPVLSKKSMIGCRVSVHWARLGRDYCGVVTAYFDDKDEYEVRFDDGEVHREIREDMKIVAVAIASQPNTLPAVGLDSGMQLSSVPVPDTMMSAEPNATLSDSATEQTQSADKSVRTSFSAIPRVALAECATYVIEKVSTQDVEPGLMLDVLATMEKVVRLARSSGELGRMLIGETVDAESIVDFGELVHILLTEFVEKGTFREKWTWGDSQSTDECVVSVKLAFWSAAICVHLAQAYCNTNLGDRAGHTCDFSLEDVVSATVQLLHNQMEHNLEQFYMDRLGDIKGDIEASSPGSTKRRKAALVPPSAVATDAKKCISLSASILEGITDVVLCANERFTDTAITTATSCALWPYFLDDENPLWDEDGGSLMHLLQSTSAPLLEGLCQIYSHLRENLIGEMADGVCTGVFPASKKLRMKLRRVDVSNRVNTLNTSPGFAAELTNSLDARSANHTVDQSSVLYVSWILLRCLQSCGGLAQERETPDVSPPASKRQRGSGVIEEPCKTTDLPPAKLTAHGQIETIQLTEKFISTVWGACADRKDRRVGDQTATLVSQFFEYLFQDMLRLCFGAEWPAAEVVLDVVCVKLRDAITGQDESAKVLQSHAIGWLGSITAALRPIVRSGSEASDLKFFRAIRQPSGTEDTDMVQASAVASNPDGPYCVCRSVEEMGFMVQCDSCQEWFHDSCIQISETDLPAEMEEGDWACYNCVAWKKLLELSRDAVQDVPLPETQKRDWSERLAMRSAIAHYLSQEEAVFTLEPTESRVCQNARNFYLAMWLQNDIAELRNAHPDDSDISIPPTLHRWYQREYQTDDSDSVSRRAEVVQRVKKVAASAPTIASKSAISVFAAALGSVRPLLMHSSTTFPRIIIDVLRENPVDLPEKDSVTETHLGVSVIKGAINALRHISTEDPLLLADPSIELTVRGRMVDDSQSVREAVINLVGDQIKLYPRKFFTAPKPSADGGYLSMMLLRLRDRGVNVRSRALAIICDVLLSDPSHPCAADMVQHLIHISNSLFSHSERSHHDAKEEKEKDRTAEDRILTRATATVRKLLFDNQGAPLLKVADGHTAGSSLFAVEDRADLLSKLCSLSESSSLLKVDVHTQDDNISLGRQLAFDIDPSGGYADKKLDWLVKFLQRSLDDKQVNEEMCRTMLTALLSWIDTCDTVLSKVLEGLNAESENLHGSKQDTIKAGIKAMEDQRDLFEGVFCIGKVFPGLLLGEEHAVAFSTLSNGAIGGLAKDLAVKLSDNTLQIEPDISKKATTLSYETCFLCMDLISTLLAASGPGESFDFADFNRLQDELKKNLYNATRSDMLSTSARCLATVMQRGSFSVNLGEQIFKKEHTTFISGVRFLSERANPKPQNQSPYYLKGGIFLQKHFVAELALVSILARNFDWDDIFSRSSCDADLRDSFANMKSGTLKYFEEKMSGHEDLLQDIEDARADSNRFCVPESVAFSLIRVAQFATLLLKVCTEKPESPVLANLPAGALNSIVRQSVRGIANCAWRSPWIMLAVAPFYKSLLLGVADGGDDARIVMQNLEGVTPKVICKRDVRVAILDTVETFYLAREWIRSHGKLGNECLSFSRDRVKIAGDQTDLAKAVASALGPGDLGNRSDSVEIALLSREDSLRWPATRLLFFTLKFGLRESVSWVSQLLALQFDNSIRYGPYVAAVALRLLKSVKKVSPGQLTKSETLARGLHLGRDLVSRQRNGNSTNISCVVRRPSPSGPVQQSALAGFFLILAPKYRLELIRELLRMIEPRMSTTDDWLDSITFTRWVAECVCSLPYDHEHEVLDLIYACSKLMAHPGGVIEKALKTSVDSQGAEFVSTDFHSPAALLKSSFRLVAIATIKDVVKTAYRLTDKKCAAYNPDRPRSDHKTSGAHMTTSPFGALLPAISDERLAKHTDAVDDDGLKSILEAWKGTGKFSTDFTNTLPKNVVRNRKRKAAQEIKANASASPVKARPKASASPVKAEAADGAVPKRKRGRPKRATAVKTAERIAEQAVSGGESD